MYTDEARRALEFKKILQLRYDGFTRDVEVHTIGYSTANNLVMSCYQVRSGSVSGSGRGWKLMRLDEARGATLLNEPSGAPRSGYQRNDSRFSRILYQL